MTAGSVAKVPRIETVSIAWSSSTVVTFAVIEAQIPVRPWIRSIPAMQAGSLSRALTKSILQKFILFVYRNLRCSTKWNAISPADQKAIEKINEEYAEKFGKGWVELDNNAVAFAKGKGVTFVKVSKEDEAFTAQKMKPILDDYVKMTKAKGLPGDEALKFVQDFLQKNQ